MASARDVSFTGSSKLYGTAAAPDEGKGGSPGSKGGVTFKVLVTENARLRRTPGASKAGKYDFLLPSSGGKRLGTSKMAPVGLGHDFKSVIAASPGRLADASSPEERRHLARLQVLQRENEQARNALGAIESTRRATTRREREEIQDTGTLSNLLPKWYSDTSPVQHPQPGSPPGGDGGVGAAPSPAPALHEADSFEAVLAAAKAAEAGDGTPLPPVPDVPPPLPDAVAAPGPLSLEDGADAAAAAAAAEDELEEGVPPLTPDEFLGVITAHGWVRTEALEELRQTRAEAAQRLRDIESGSDGLSLAAHAASTGGMAGGSSSAALRELLVRAGVPQSGASSPSPRGGALPALPDGSPLRSPGGSALAEEQAALPTHRPLPSLLVASAVGIASTTHIPVGTPPRVPHGAAALLGPLADSATASELDAWLAVQRWAVGHAQEELLGVRRRLVAAYREATPEGVAYETSEAVSTEQLHGAATAAADGAVAAWQQGPKLPEVGLQEAAQALLAGHKFVHNLLGARTAAGTAELQGVLDRFARVLPELQARVTVKREQDEALQKETAAMARAVAQLRSAALAAGVPHPGDIASGRAGGATKAPGSARPLMLEGGEGSPRKAFERAAADVAAQFVSATRRAREALGDSSMAPTPALAAAGVALPGEGDTIFKAGEDVHVEALATMLEALGPEGTAAARERELAAVTAQAAAEVAAAFRPRLDAVRDEAQQAIDDANIGSIATKQSFESSARDLARQVYTARRKELDAKSAALTKHEAALKLALRRLEATAAGALELALLKPRVRQMWAEAGLAMAVPEAGQGERPLHATPSFLTPLPPPARSAVTEAVLSVVAALGPESEAAMLRAEATETGDAAFQQFARNVNHFLAATLQACTARPDLAPGILAGTSQPPAAAANPPVGLLARPLSYRYDSMLHGALSATKRRLQLAAAAVTWTSKPVAEKAAAVTSADDVLQAFHVEWPSRAATAAGQRHGTAGVDTALLLAGKDAPMGVAPREPRASPGQDGASAAANAALAKDGSTAAALAGLEGSAAGGTVGADWDGEYLRYFRRTWAAPQWAAVAKTFANSSAYRALLEAAGEASDTPRTDAIVTRSRFGLADTGGSAPTLSHIHAAYQYDSTRERLLAAWR